MEVRRQANQNIRNYINLGNRKIGEQLAFTDLNKTAHISGQSIEWARLHLGPIEKFFGWMIDKIIEKKGFLFIVSSFYPYTSYVKHKGCI